ncbi:MAG: DNA polymerase III subunit beta [Desulfobacterales bacterium]|nr:DNA polymerase III subunit beta [Desulfobacterales bacterium]
MTINQALIEKIISVAKRYGATRLILFGSALEMPGQARDIDLACDGIEGWKLYEMAAKIEEELGASLDIVPLNPPTRFTRIIEAKGKTLL